MPITTYRELEELALAEGHRGIDGVPSCSRLPQLKLCPGSMWAIIQGKTQNNSGGSAADMGTIIHKAMELRDMPADAPTEALDKYNWMQAKLADLREAGWEDWISEEYFELSHKGDPILTGAVDCIMVKRDGAVIVEALVIDYKTGRNKVDSSSVQMQAYCLMAEEQHRQDVHEDCKWHIYAMQPMHPNNRIVALEMEEADQLVHSILEDCEFGKGGVRIPGTKQCKYCNAHNTITCPDTMTKAAELAENGEL